jgi:hypothetical protein
MPSDDAGTKGLHMNLSPWPIIPYRWAFCYVAHVDEESLKYKDDQLI